MESARDDLRFLNGLANAAPTALIYGRIALSNGPGLAQPAAGAIVTVRGAQSTLTTTTDGDGRYAANGLKPGQYQITAGHPGYQMPGFGQWTFRTEVEPRGCGLVNVELWRRLPVTVAEH